MVGPSTRKLLETNTNSSRNSTKRSKGAWHLRSKSVPPTLVFTCRHDTVPARLDDSRSFHCYLSRRAIGFRHIDVHNGTGRIARTYQFEITLFPLVIHEAFNRAVDI